jgi:hypothetical protein
VSDWLSVLHFFEFLLISFSCCCHFPSY